MDTLVDGALAAVQTVPVTGHVSCATIHLLAVTLAH